MITAAINFLIVAAVVYFLIVMPMNKVTEAMARRNAEEVEDEPEPLEVTLLSEIRDLLKQNRA